MTLLLAASLAAGCDRQAPQDDDDSSRGDDDDSTADDDDDSSAATGPWAWCPSAADYQGDSTWLQAIEVTADALYCASFDESRTLEEEPSFKAKLRIIDGTYPLPHEDGLGSLTLPVCVQMAVGQDLPVMAGGGNVDTNISSWQDTIFYSHLLEQPMQDAAGSTWWISATLRLESTVPGQQPLPLVLDGSAPSPWSGLGGDFSLCPGDAQSCSQGRRFLACNPLSYRLQRHVVTFTGGEITLDLRMGESMAATEPAAFVRASGTLDGQSFAQEDYWKLIYNPSHHHFSRDFAVLFDAPIGSVCGLKASEVDPWGDPPLAQIHTIHCDLEEIDERSVSAESYQQIDP